MPGGRRPLVIAAAALAVCLVVALVVVGNRYWRDGVDREPAAATAGSPSVSPSPTPTGIGGLGTAPRSKSPSPKPSTVNTKRPGGKPGPGNTGVPPGTKLKVVTGDQTYDTPNQVISGLDIRGFVTVTARNVTIQNSIIRGGPNPPCNSSVLFIKGSATIKDSEIDPSHPNPCLDGIWAANATLLRMDIHGAVDGVKAYDNVTLLDSWVHDLSRFASDPNQGGGPTHNDAVQTYEGNRNITLRHNNLDLDAEDNAAYQVTQDGGQRATDLRIEDNWLDGGGCTLNFAHKGGPTPMTGIVVTGNRFGRDSAYGCPILVSTQTVLSRNSGNVFADDGRPIPAPQRHD